ncbi:MAG TPA: chaperone modulator CbpM [Blastocatellia bacterium]|nr:chaperone modulator CbpM [Blastocatellia bacterium]
MTERHYQIVLCRSEREQLSQEALASSVGLHPALVERFVEFGLLDPAGWVGTQLLFDAAAVPRLRTIERLRGEIGVNLAGVAVVLDLLDRLRALQDENERLRSR